MVLKKNVKIVSPTSFENVARTHARVLLSIPRWMFDHFDEMGSSKTLKNIVKLGRPIFPEMLFSLLHDFYTLF